MNLSIIIIVPEDQKNSASIKRAIRSAQFADEILVIPQKFPILDFAKIRNEALERAKGEWVLYLDSDEIISEDLSSEIKSQISNLKSQNHNEKLKADKKNGFYNKRQDRFLGKWLKYGETAHVKLLRLARKDAGKWVRPVHEVWHVEGAVGTLREPILHYSHRTIDEMIEKIDWYTDLESKYRKSVTQKMYYNQSGRTRYNTFLIFSLGISPLGKFVQNYVLRLGFLDGMPGFIHAAMMSFHSFLVRAKILSRMAENENQRITRISE
jgi:glycosyltransferase involved in cell wall biosynthesis